MIGPTIDDKFPNLQGSTQDKVDFDLYKYLDGSWGIISVYPCDFDSVSTTELAAVARLAACGDLKKRNVKFCGFSLNDAQSHRTWIIDVKATTGAPIASLPIFSDPDRKFAMKLGILNENNNNINMRSVYVVRPDKTIVLLTMNSKSTGASFDEILREIDALQMASKYFVNTPADWKSGEKVIIEPSLSDKDADKEFKKVGYTTVEVPSEKHYMRYTTDPDHPPVVAAAYLHRFAACTS